MKPVMYLIAASEVAMSPGKFGAQCAHAAVLAYRISGDSIINQWFLGGHYTKIVLEAPDLIVAERYIRDREFKTVFVIDEGRTEVPPLTPTVIGVEIVDKDSAHVAATFGEFKLYGTKQREREAAEEALMKLREDFGISERVAPPRWWGWWPGQR